MLVYVLALEVGDGNLLQLVLVTIDTPYGSIGPQQGRSTRQK